jgi:hypothetical protein
MFYPRRQVMPEASQCWIQDPYVPIADSFNIFDASLIMVHIADLGSLYSCTEMTVDSDSTHGTVRLEFGRGFAEASTKNPLNNGFGCVFAFFGCV